MTFVYFAHAPDQKILEQSIRNLRRLYSKPRIVVFWEQGKEGFVEGVENKTTSFSRGGNLNGIDCCRGIIDCMLEQQGTVVKIDCDTIIIDKIPEVDGFLFYESVQAFCGVGCCYAITNDVLKLCAAKLKDYVAFSHSQYSEDLTISVLCQNVAKGELKLWNGGQHILGYDYSMNWERFCKAQVIHMGNPNPKYDQRIKKARDFAHMKMFVDYLEKQNSSVSSSDESD